MTSKDDIREFLVARRASVTPAQAGIHDFGGERRVPGLRREEVAELAGVSLDYYTRLERGNIRGVSESVLNAIARALQLNDVERAHLFDLARGTTPTASPDDARRHDTHSAHSSVRTSVQRVLDNLAVPAVVRNAQQDLVAANLMDERCTRHTSRPTGRTSPGSSSWTPAPRSTTWTGLWPAA